MLSLSFSKDMLLILLVTVLYFESSDSLIQTRSKYNSNNLLLHTAKSRFQFPAIKSIHLLRLKTSDDSSVDGTTETAISLQTNSQIARLNAKAAQLRAEAASLEAVQRADYLEKLAEAFTTFDTNRDNSINVKELKEGFLNHLKISVTEEQARKVIDMFDTNLDGSIQLSEFQGIDAFQRKLDIILAEEKSASLQAKIKATNAKQLAEKEKQKAAFIESQVNNLPPTASDKIVSLLPYLLPLADVLPYSRDFINANNLGANNAIYNFASEVFNIYHSIPLSGLIAFFVLTRLGSNLQLNRLVRFNMYQAFQLDIFLILPEFINFSVSSLANLLKFEIPVELSSYGSTLIFLSVSLAILYSMVTSITGNLPNQLPFISSQVEKQIPTTEQLLKQLNEMEARAAEANEYLNKQKEKMDKEMKDKENKDNDSNNSDKK